MSVQIEWTCKRCDADNSVCDCKKEHSIMVRRYIFKDAMLVLIIGYCLGNINQLILNKAMESQAIVHNAAQYNATTGEFEWLK